MQLKKDCFHKPLRQLGFSNQQALMLLVLALPLGLIAISIAFIILNNLKESTNDKAVAPPSTTKMDSIGIIDEERSSTETAQPTNDMPSEIASAGPGPAVIELGSASTGAPVRLIVNSIVPLGGGSHAFNYQLGSTTIRARANCSEQNWVSYPENQINRPQSDATLKMLQIICSETIGNTPASPSINSNYPGTAIVFDPPSNIRQTPGGSFLCTVKSKTTVSVGNPNGNWYPTSACGSRGFIHKSQIRF